MPEAPTRAEWLSVYAPLAASPTAALVVEAASGRIPKWVSVVTLAYLLGARLVLGPAQVRWHLLSLVIGAAAAVGFAWGQGYLGGGAAKMAVAAPVAFPPLLALVFAAGLVLGCLALVWTGRWHGSRTMRGSPLLLALTFAVTCVPDLANGICSLTRAGAAAPAPIDRPAQRLPTRDHGEDW
jgi:hypothetical protein